MFASVYLPTRQHKIKRLHDGFWQDLNIGLITLQFQIMRALIEATQSLEIMMNKGEQVNIEQGLTRLGKRNEHVYSSGRLVLLKKGKRD